MSDELRVMGHMTAREPSAHTTASAMKVQQQVTTFTKTFTPLKGQSRESQRSHCEDNSQTTAAYDPLTLVRVGGQQRY